MNYLDPSSLSEAERWRLADAIVAGRPVPLREVEPPANLACCVFCDATFALADVVEHVRGCEKHPLRAALLERDAALARSARWKALARRKRKHHLFALNALAHNLRRAEYLEEEARADAEAQIIARVETERRERAERERDTAVAALEKARAGAPKQAE